MVAPNFTKSGSPQTWKSTKTAGSTLSGSSTGRDHLTASAKNVTLSGSAQDDTYAAYDSSTQFVEAANGGIDSVHTWGSGITLAANIENLALLGNGNDVGTGNSGNNIIWAKYGNDRVITGGGNDLLVSGTGANTFVPTKQNGSVTWVQGFKTSGAALDKLEVLGFGLQGFAAVQSKMTQVGTDVKIDLGNGQTVMFENKKVADFKAANFVVEAGGSNPPPVDPPPVEPPPPTPGTGPSATISNSANLADLSSSFKAATTATSTSTTYTNGQLKLAATDASANVTVSYDANNAMTVKNNGIWNAVKNATVTSAGHGNVTVNNFVGAAITLGNGGDSTVKVTDAKRGNITTGSGNDTVTVNALSNSNDENVMTIATGAGNDTLSFSGAANAKAVLKGDAGNDTFDVKGPAMVTVTGGAGADMFHFAAGTRATLTDFNAAEDKISLSGVSAGNVSLTAQSGGTLLNLGNGSTILLAGQTVTQSTSSIVFADGSKWSSSPPPVDPPPPVEPPPAGGLPKPNAPVGSTYKMTFDEEFNSLSMNTGTTATKSNTWQTWDGWGNRTLSSNGELQWYVDPDYKGLGLNPFSINDGVLKITAAKVPNASVQQALYGYKYTSGELTTASSFSQKYGFFEMKAQMAGGKGIWPAFWMLATDKSWPPEIDIVEYIGDQPNTLYTTLHTKDGNSGKGTNGGVDLSKGFHTYGVDWQSDKITFYFDGKAVFSRNTPSDMHKPMYMLLNLAVGGHWPGSPDATTDWTKTNMYIDYVRVWSKDQNAAVYKNVPTGTTQTAAAPLMAATASTTSSTESQADTGTGPAVTISNGMDALDLSDSFKATVTAAGTSKSYSNSELDLGGTDASANVTVSYDADNAVTITNTGAWSAVRNVTVDEDTHGRVTTNNFVDARITLGDGGDSTVVVNDAKRGSIVTGSGDDSITVNALSNGTTENIMAIDAGAGDDIVRFSGAANTATTIKGGDGADRISVDGGAMALIDAGAGNDRIAVTSTGETVINGGAGADVFSFIAGAHATITDFNATEDSLSFGGLSASNVTVTQQSGGTLIDFGGGSNVLLAGVSVPQNQINMAFA